MIDLGHIVNIVYLDLQKAFDMILHVRLVSNLTANGINGDLHKWVKSYLGSMKQSVQQKVGYLMHRSR